MWVPWLKRRKKEGLELWLGKELLTPTPLCPPTPFGSSDSSAPTRNDSPQGAVKKRQSSCHRACLFFNTPRIEYLHTFPKDPGAQEILHIVNVLLVVNVLLDSVNRAICIELQITSVHWGSYLPPKHRTLSS